MRKIRDILRLKAQGLTVRQIAVSVGSARSTITECLHRAEAAGVSWPLPEGSDAALEVALYPPRTAPQRSQALPDWASLHQELHRPGVTLQLLWEEYAADHLDGYRYSRFCDLYRDWTGKLDLVMRQVHRAGEKLFVDYAGQTLPIVDRQTGTVRPAQVFVAVLGVSSYTYAEASWTQRLPDWLAAHVRAFEFLGACPAILVPDNLKSAVVKAHRYEPDLNPAYQALADHYGVAVIPARVRKPRDKAKAEAGVLLVERWILARLRRQTFFSLDQANRAIRECLDLLNARSFRKLPGSRRTLFESLDRPALRPLPAQPYEFAEFKRARVNIDYPVELDHHYYSVPHALARQEVELRYTASTVEILHRGTRVASHVRSSLPRGHTTVAAHMPEAHRRHAEWTPERLIRWADTIGPATSRCVAGIMAARRHPEQGFRACLGLLRLSDRYGVERLEAACVRAAALSAFRYKTVASILKSGLDRQAQSPAVSTTPRDHAHVRGAGYFH